MHDFISYLMEVKKVKIDKNKGKVIKCDNGAVIHLLSNTRGDYYLSVCEVCAKKDPEMHGFIIERSLSAIKHKSATKCGCAKYFDYSDLQYRLRLKILNNDINYPFTIITQAIDNRRSEIVMHCKKHDITFKSNFIKITEGYYLCKSCKKEALHALIEDKKKTTLVAGVGVNDADYRVTKKENGVIVWECPYYSLWRNMLKRCYIERPSYKSYSNVTVCKDWHTFTNFKQWMEDKDWEGKQLDKDILSMLNGGEKQYNSSNCLFVTKEVNMFFQIQNKNSITGASWVRSYNKYNAGGYSKGKYYFLGSFKTRVEAHKVWQGWRIGLLRDMRDNQKDPDVYCALSRCVDKMQNEIDNGIITTWL